MRLHAAKACDLLRKEKICQARCRGGSCLLSQMPRGLYRNNFKRVKQPLENHIPVRVCVRVRVRVTLLGFQIRFNAYI